MSGRKLLLLNLAFVLSGATVLDQIAIIAGKHAIKTSDIDRNLRLTQFLNNEPLDLRDEAKRRKAAQRLIDQAIIRDEAEIAGFALPNASDADALIAQLRRDRFAGSDEHLRGALTRYGLNLGQLQEHLVWQLAVLRFIDQRFRPGVLVTDEEVKSYYDQHLQELRKAYPRTTGFQALEPKIRESLTGERINSAFEEWLNEARQRTRIEYREQGLQ